MKVFKKLRKSISGQRDRVTSTATSTVNVNPSVQDFFTVKDLKQALLGKGGKKKKKKKKTLSISTASTEGTVESADSHCADESLVEQVPDHDALAWKLSNLDVANSEPQTMEMEVQRLTALQSYFILDADTSAEFDRITEMACKVFNVPVACVTMIDLGRLWFLTATGIPNANGIEAPRKVAICAHVVKTNLSCLVVPDASKDERFRDSPLVADPNGPAIRFYAGVPLKVPEGAKLGTFCIIDQKPRHEPFTQNDQQVLQDMAALAVNALVARRNRLLKQEQDAKMLELAESYAEMHSCLCKAQSCVQRSSSVASKSRRSSGLGSFTGDNTIIWEETKSTDGHVQDDQDVDHDHQDDDNTFHSTVSFEALTDEIKLQADISAANARTIVMEATETAQFEFENMQVLEDADAQELQIAKKRIPPAYVRLLQQNQNNTNNGEDNFSVGSRSLRSKGTGNHAHTNNKKTVDAPGSIHDAVNAMDVFQNLNDICSRFTRPVPIYLELLGNVPVTMHCRGSDLLIFQATMSLLANANSRVHKWDTDEDDGMIHLKLKTINGGTTLVVECQDTGCFAAEWEGSMEFHNPRSLLYPVRKISRSLGGDCGMRLGCFAEEDGMGDSKAGHMRADAEQAGVELLDDVEHEQQYCIFWWSMPLVMMGCADDGLDGSDSLNSATEEEREEEDERQTILKVHESTRKRNK